MTPGHAFRTTALKQSLNIRILDPPLPKQLSPKHQSEAKKQELLHRQQLEKLPKAPCASGSLSSESLLLHITGPEGV